MKYWVIAAVLMLAAGCSHERKQAQATAQPQNPPAQPQQVTAQAPAPPPAPATGISLPSDTKLVASMEVDEIRAFPEMHGRAQAQPGAMTQPQPRAAAEGVVHARAVDNVYQTGKSYKDSVEFIDKQINKQGLTSMARVDTRSATTWTLDLGNGQIESVVIRNTKPTTIETIAAKGTEVHLVD